jgi:small nuclear ribonucleoprotein F
MPVLPPLKNHKADVVPINPKPFLQDLTGKSIVVKLKWGQEYHGRLNAVDSYMNLKLTGTEEWREGKNEGMLGEVFIRCNNVLWVSESNGEKMQED